MALLLMVGAIISSFVLRWLIKQMERAESEPRMKDISDFEKLVQESPEKIDSIANEIINYSGEVRSNSNQSREAVTEMLIRQTPQGVRDFFGKYRSLSYDHLTRSLDEEAVKVSEMSDAYIVIGYWITGEPALVEKGTGKETIFVENWEYSPEGPISPLAPSLKYYLALVKQYMDGSKATR